MEAGPGIINTWEIVRYIPKTPSLLAPPTCAHTYLHLPLRGQLDNGCSIHLPKQHTACPWGRGNSVATLHKSQGGFHGDLRPHPTLPLPFRGTGDTEDHTL